MEQVAQLKRAWNLAPVLQIVQKIPENFWAKLMSCGSKDIFKNALSDVLILIMMSQIWSWFLPPSPSASL